MTVAPVRPTPVIVIGWVWCILGIALASGGALALIVAQWQPLPRELPWRALPILAPIQILMGLTGVVAGIRFLRLEPWARRVLEVLTILMIVLVVGVNAIVASMWTSAVEEAPGPMRHVGVVAAVFSTLLYGGGLAFMLYRLRGSEVRDALERDR
jgi:hypothetical protein